MKCKKYGCVLSETACAIRWRNANKKPKKTQGNWSATRKPGFMDTGCLNCEVGKIVHEKVGPREAAKYSKTLKETRDRALILKTAGIKKSDSLEMLKLEREHLMDRIRVIDDMLSAHGGRR
jgi:homospermidine synthase